MMTAILVVGLFSGCRRHEPADDYVFVPVVVTKRDLPEGTILSHDLLAKYQMPESVVTSTIVNPSQTNEVVGRKLLADMRQGDILCWPLVGPEPGSSPPRHSNVIRKRLRTIAVQAEGGSRVRPDDHVDVLLTIQDEETGKPFTFTLFENVFALESGATLIKFLGKERAGPLRDRVSLMLLPDEARILALASRHGSLHVTIRTPDEPCPKLNGEGAP
jgi:pilus assembly protein CpaB